MKSVITKWSSINYGSDYSSDYSELFSKEVDEGWQIVSLSTCIDTFEESRIIVITALLDKPDPNQA